MKYVAKKQSFKSIFVSLSQKLIVWLHSQAPGILSRNISFILNSFPREVFSFCRTHQLKSGNLRWCKSFLKFPLQHPLWTLLPPRKERGILSSLTTFIGAINLYDLVHWTPCLIHFNAPVVLAYVLLKSHKPKSTIITFTSDWLNFWF